MSALRCFTGWFRQFRSFVLRREVEIIGQCALCGSCCHDILLQDGRRWLSKRKQFEKLCKAEPEYERFVITGRDDLGHLSFSCSCQGEDGFCTSYDSRLPLCRNYPSKSLYYQGGWIRADCGYSFKAVTFRDVLLRGRKGRKQDFSAILRQETKRTQD